MGISGLFFKSTGFKFFFFFLYDDDLQALHMETLNQILLLSSKV